MLQGTQETFCTDMLDHVDSVIGRRSGCGVSTKAAGTDPVGFS